MEENGSGDDDYSWTDHHDAGLLSSSIKNDDDHAWYFAKTFVWYDTNIGTR
jgi:hypothetical protein